ERPAWWTSSRYAGTQIEPPFVTRTIETALSRSRDHRTRKVRARLIKRDKLVRRQADQQATIVFIRVRESDRGTDGQIVGGGDPLYGRLTTPMSIPVLHADPELPERERRAGQHHEFHEVSTLDIQILRPIDWEILSPRWLQIRRPEIRGDRNLF